jgi:uncharacterized iron-regulated membrane protein
VSGTVALARRALVWLHRWVGLLMAVLLILEGLTGALLAYEEPIGNWLEPRPQRAQGDASRPLIDMARLATLVEQRAPEVEVGYFSSWGSETAVVRCHPRVDPSTHRPLAPDFDHIVLDARTGREIARLPRDAATRPWRTRIMPIVRELHVNLLLSDTGGWILFLLALAWTLDCFGGFLLTLPKTLVRWWQRWLPAWGVRLRAGGYRLVFDTHRAGGLWLWLAWFAFAWSSVQLEQHWDVYDTVMDALFDTAQTPEALAQWPHQPAGTRPRLGWIEAQTRGEALMRQEAARRGFGIEAPTQLAYFITENIYSYSVRTDRSFPAYAEEGLYLDGDTGERLQLPGMELKTGDRVSDWLRGIHMARDPLDKPLYHALLCLAGIALIALSITGVVIWWRKRVGRRAY